MKDFRREKVGFSNQKEKKNESLGESLGPRRFTFPQSIKNIKPERETFSNYSNKKIKKIFSTFKLYYSQRDFIKKKKMEFFDRVQPDLNMEKLFTMSHRKSIFSSSAVFSVPVVGVKSTQKCDNFAGKFKRKGLAKKSICAGLK